MALLLYRLLPQNWYHRHRQSHTESRRRTTAVKRKPSRFTSTTSRQESSSSACCLAITSQAAQQLNHRRFFSSLLGSQRSWDSIFSSTRSLGSTLTTVEVNRLLLSHLSSLKMTLTTRWDVDDVMLSRWASVDSRWRLCCSVATLDCHSHSAKQANAIYRAAAQLEHFQWDYLRWERGVLIKFFFSPFLHYCSPDGNGVWLPPDITLFAPTIVKTCSRQDLHSHA